MSSLVAFIAIGLLFNFGESLFLAMRAGAESYSTVSQETGAGGLGYHVVVNQPLPIKIFMGSLYLFIFPIPVWAGIQLDSAYHLFKSLNAPFFYALLPLLIIAARHITLGVTARSNEALFLFFVCVGFVSSIAVTSLETRHLAAFLMPIFLFAILPDFRLKTIRRQYHVILAIWMFLLLLIHMAWGWLKI